MFRTKEERENLWQRNQVRFAEIAHEYLCRDVPTITQCLLCSHEPEQCRNKAEALKAIANYKEWHDEVPWNCLRDDIIALARDEDGAWCGYTIFDQLKGGKSQ